MPNKYEMIFPDLNNEALNDQYEMFIKKANDIWDEFTTGKSRKPNAEKQQVEAQKRKELDLQKRKEKREKDRKDKEKAKEKAQKAKEE